MTHCTFESQFVQCAFPRLSCKSKPVGVQVCHAALPREHTCVCVYVFTHERRIVPAEQTLYEARQPS